MTDLPRTAEGESALDVARRCAALASAIMRENFGSTALAGVKGRGNVVTETDLAVEKAVAQTLRDAFPDHALLAEETAAETRAQGWTWVVDPVDGTKNFSRGIPHFCFTIALCHDAEPLLALTRQPLLQEEYLAVAGRGATLNDHPIHVSEAASVRESVVAVDLGYSDVRGKRQLELAQALFPGVESLRIPGSAALGLAYVAAGRYDIFVHANLYPWDLAAGLLLIREAGGIVTDRDGDPAALLSEGVVAATPRAHADFMRIAGGLPWRQ